MKRVISNGRKKVNKLHSSISNRNINLSARRLLLLSVLRPSIEFGSVIKVRQVPLNLFSWGKQKRFLEAHLRLAHLRLVMRQLEGTWV